jgi:hypothetical protein
LWLWLLLFRGCFCGFGCEFIDSASQE